jgi:hypothetical protein
VNGKTTAELAGVHLTNGMESIATTVLQELEKDMQQHGLHPQMIAPAILERCQQLTSASKQSEQGQRIGSNGSDNNGSTSARERALAAAERRAKQQPEGEKDNGDKSSQ